MIEKPQHPCAAISLIEHTGDERLLVVWNRRYGGWTLPGGKVEDGETVEHAQQRELLEETGVGTADASLVYEGPTSATKEADRGRYCYVFRVTPSLGSRARQTEPGTPVSWFTREEFLRWSCFAPFYEKMFSSEDKKCRY